jgi:ATP-binding cassette subfamily B protein
MFGEVALRLLEPWPLKFVFDRVITSTPSGGTSGVAAVDELSPMALLTLCAVALVAIAGVRALCIYLNRVGFALAGNRVLTEMRTELFTHLQRLSLSFHDRNRTGDLITRVTGDVGRLKEVAVTAALPLVVHSATLVGMVAIMFVMEWRLSLVTLAVLPLFFLSTQRLGGRIRTLARKQRQREGDIGATTAEAMGAIRVVQSLSIEDVQASAFSAKNRKSLKEGVKIKRLTARLVGIVDLLIAIGTAVVLWYGARLVLQDAMTPGDLVLFLAYLKNAFKPTRNLAKYSGRLARAAASAERIIEVLDAVPLIHDRPHAKPAPQRVESVAFSDVSFEYEAGHPVLEGIDFRVERGRVLAIAGPSGAGKSTLLNLLLRLYDPSSGHISFDGTDIRDFTYRSVRQRIALVPQDTVLFGVSVRENIAHGDADASEEQIVEAARMARAHDFITQLPDGYDTVIGERGETLSQGQRQRIAIARAVVRGAPVLVLDEPTSSLDNANNELICEALQALRKDRMTFIIAHDLSTVAEADEILFLDRGRVVERGSHEALLAAGGAYAAMHARRAGHPPPDTGQEGVHAVRG